MTNNPTEKKPQKRKRFSPEDAIQMAISLIKEEKSTPQSVIKTIFIKLTEELPPEAFPEEALTTMSQEIYTQASKRIQTQLELEDQEKSISFTDLAAIETLISQNAEAIAATFSAPQPDLSAAMSSYLDKHRMMNLMAAFAAHALAFYHHSGWIRYNRKDIFTLAQLNKLPVSEQEKLIKTMHSFFGLNMRVIGSAQPIPCYGLSWLIPPTEDSPIHKLNPTKIKTSIMSELSLAPIFKI